jgi:beta-lactamase regulating signal transducer with metallopeptidase domain
MTANLSHLIPLAVERTLDSLVGGLVLGGVAWTWLRVARRQNSASRFFILFILLVGIAVLPVVGLSWVGSLRTTGLAEAHSLITLPQHAAAYLFATWAVIAFLALSRIAVGFLQLRRLKQSCIAISDEALDPRVRSSLLDSPRPVLLCTSERVSVPTALGLATPAKIVIPEWLMGELSTDELHHLVLHELAHLRRWDDWTNLAQRILGALFFFHPAMWWLQHRLSLEREMACDECVLAQTGNARGYAKSLANIAERSFVRRSLALAQAAVSKLHDTTLRVSKILGSSPARESRSKLPLFASAAAMSAVTVAVALFSPDLVSFSQPKSVPAIAAEHSANQQFESVKPTLAALHANARRTVKAVPAKAADPQPTTDLPESFIAQQEPMGYPRNATEPKGPTVVPARLVDPHHAIAPQQAVLVYWQETYVDDSGVVMQRTMWHVLLLNTPVQKEPAKKI